MASAFKVPATRLLVRCVSERIRWSRGAFEETPAGELCIVDREQGARIAALRDRYQVQYERRMSAATSLDRAGAVSRRARADRLCRRLFAASAGCAFRGRGLWRLSRTSRPHYACFPLSAAPGGLFLGHPWAAGSGLGGALVHRSRLGVHGACRNPGGVEQASIDAAGTVLVDASITLKIFVFISKLL
jgi:hypothetical protein